MIDPEIVAEMAESDQPDAEAIARIEGALLAKKEQEEADAKLDAVRLRKERFTVWEFNYNMYGAMTHGGYAGFQWR